MTTCCREGCKEPGKIIFRNEEDKRLTNPFCVAHAIEAVAGLKSATIEQKVDILAKMGLSLTALRGFSHDQRN